MKENSFSSRRAGKLILISCNVALVLAVVAFVVYYTSRVSTEQEAMVRDSFCDTVETMKQLSSRYLDSERHVAEEWAAYIEHQNMTLDEALDYLRAVNTDSDRYAHLIDMNTYEARSTLASDGDDIVTDYQRFASSSDQNTSHFLLETMQRMFAGETHVLGRYRLFSSQITVVSVGTSVFLNTRDGWQKRYLLLRVIPVESLRKIWIFPMNYANAEIGMITSSGDYVIPSGSMRSENFLEFIRAYNFADDYNGIDTLLSQLQNTDSGLLEFNNSRGELCYWYYSRLDGYEGQLILGYVPKGALDPSSNTSIPIVLVISGLLLVLMIIDGAYVLSINHRLRISVKLAEQASEAKTQFLSTMSHDIRTPLNAVIGMTQLAQEHMTDPVYVENCLSKISVSGSHLLTLINDVLELSRVESGKTALSPAPFSLEALTGRLESITLAQAHGREQHFEMQLHDISSPYLIGDKLRLSQVYLNLLNNAVKYTQTGGSIRMDMWEEPVDEQHISLVCTIADNGIGMTPEFQATMYESFSRAIDGRIDKTQGTGLGLAIVRHMLDLMEGTILCDSELGKGTTFTVRITLPIADHAEQTSPASDDTGENVLNGMHILIAEDNDLNWEIISAMLEEHGILCDRAENGRICVSMLEAAPENTYGFVLMDVQMPELNGRDATREIRRSERQDLREIPIAAMTADAFAEDMQACMDAGMDAHLSKPVEIEKVLRTLVQLKGHKHDTPPVKGKRA